MVKSYLAFSSVSLWWVLLVSRIQNCQVSCQTCRMDPEASHKYCGLPKELSNFQGDSMKKTAVHCDRVQSESQPDALNAAKVAV